jgi:hypothetical protein
VQETFRFNSNSSVSSGRDIISNNAIAVHCPTSAAALARSSSSITNTSHRIVNCTTRCAPHCLQESGLYLKKKSGFDTRNTHENSDWHTGTSPPLHLPVNIARPPQNLVSGRVTGRFSTLRTQTWLCFEQKRGCEVKGDKERGTSLDVPHGRC